MRIQNNLNAYGASNRLGSNVIGVKKTTEKLASGLRINRSGDDAAGLAISEKIRALSQSGFAVNIKNINKGLGMVNVADGAMQEIHAIAQRMRELAVQAANGTYHDELDREAIEAEFQALKGEIERITTYTEYNGIKVFESIENLVPIGVAGKTFGDVDISSDIFYIFPGNNDTLTFRYNGVPHSITIPPRTFPDSYTRAELVNVLNAEFAKVLGPNRITVSTGDSELGESSYSLVYDAHGGVFDSFGGNMMWRDNFIGIFAASSIISNNFVRGGTTVAELRGSMNIQAGVNITAGQNNLSFRLNGEGGGDVSINFATGFHSAQSIVNTINNHFAANDMTAQASLRSGTLVITRTVGGTGNSISNISTAGAYDAILRGFTINANATFTQTLGTTTELHPNPATFDWSNPPDGIRERDGIVFIPPVGPPTIPNPEFGTVTGTISNPQQWLSTLLPRGVTTGSPALGATVPRTDAITNPTVIDGNLELVNPGVPARWTFNQSLTGTYTVTAGLNDSFSFSYGAQNISITIPAGNHTPTQIAASINAQTSAHGISASMVGSQLVFNGAAGNFDTNFSGFSGDFLNSLLVNRNNTITEREGTGQFSQDFAGQFNVNERGFFQGAVLPANSYIHAGVNDELSFRLNGTLHSVTLPPGTHSPAQILALIQAQTAGIENLEVTLEGGRLTFTNTVEMTTGHQIPRIELVQTSSAVTTLLRSSANAAASPAGALQPQHRWHYLVSSYVIETFNTVATIPNPDHIPGNGHLLNWIFDPQQFNNTHAFVQRLPTAGFNFHSPMVIDDTNDSFVVNVTSPGGVHYSYTIDLDHGSFTVEQMHTQLNDKLSSITDVTVRVAQPVANLRIEAATGGSGWVVGLMQNNAFMTLYGKEQRVFNPAPQVIAPTSSADAVSEGRVNLSRNPVTNIVQGVNDVLEFDLVIDGAATRYRAVIAAGGYRNDELIAAMNEAIASSGAEGVVAELRTVTTGLDGDYLTTALVYTPRATGSVIIEGVGGSAAYTVFYRGTVEEHPIPPEKVIIQAGPHGGVQHSRFVTDIPVEMSQRRLGLTRASVSTRENANNAINDIDRAVRHVSLKRAKNGADFNALEAALANVVSQNENLMSAESRIRDTNMALEMMNHTKYNILQQAAQAMLAQAKNAPQGILQLLQI